MENKLSLDPRYAALTQSRRAQVALEPYGGSLQSSPQNHPTLSLDVWLGGLDLFTVSAMQLIAKPRPPKFLEIVSPSSACALLVQEAARFHNAVHFYVRF